MQDFSIKLHQLFSEYIDNNKVSKQKMAESINISRSHLHRMLKGERPIIDSIRTKLNAYLNTDFKSETSDIPYKSDRD